MTVVEEQAEVVVERGLAYATYEDSTLTLDLYVPADPTSAPIVIDPWEDFAGESPKRIGARPPR